MGEEDKGRKGRKGTQAVDDATPVNGPFLKAVVASQDLGAAGTEFERSLILSPFNNFLRTFSALLSLLFRPQPSSLSRHFIPPIFFNFVFNSKDANGSDFCFVRCFSRSAFLVTKIQ